MFRAQVLIVKRSKLYYSLWYHHTETSEWSKINEHNPMFDLLHSNTTRHNPPDA